LGSGILLTLVYHFEHLNYLTLISLYVTKKSISQHLIWFFQRTSTLEAVRNQSWGRKNGGPKALCGL